MFAEEKLKRWMLPNRTGQSKSISVWYNKCQNVKNWSLKQSQRFVTIDLSRRSLSLERLAMITDGCIYFLVGQYIEPIFKWFFIQNN